MAIRGQLSLQVNAIEKLTHEHIQTAQDFLVKAEEEFGEEDILQGSEKLWGAATHAIMANAQLKDWRSSSPRAMGEPVVRLGEEENDVSL